jgi:hypothetical protein
LGAPISQGTITGGLQKLVPLFEPLSEALMERHLTERLFHGDESVPRRRIGGDSPVQLCCTRDEGRSLGVAVQAEASNHLLLLRLRGVVVSEIGKGRTRFGQVWVVKSNASEPLMTCRNVETMSKLRGFRYRRISPGGAC